VTRQKGFTLVEVLIAFAILAVVMVSLYEASGTGLRSFEAAANVERAVLIAQSKLDWIVAQRRLPPSASGPVAGTAFTWQVETLASPAYLADLKPLSSRIQLVRLRVTWQGARGPRSIAVDRLVSLSTGGQ